jgi:hypothetical protein
LEGYLKTTIFVFLTFFWISARRVKGGVKTRRTIDRKRNGIGGIMGDYALGTGG